MVKKLKKRENGFRFSRNSLNFLCQNLPAAAASTVTPPPKTFFPTLRLTKLLFHRRFGSWSKSRQSRHSLPPLRILLSSITPLLQAGRSAATTHPLHTGSHRHSPPPLPRQSDTLSALPLKHSLLIAGIMDEMREQFLEKQIEVEIEGENFLLARHELVETDRMRNANREALTALRKTAKTTKTSVPSPFESLMKDIDPRPLVKEICATCGHHNATENTLLMFPGTDTFATIPFHAAHTILEEDQARLDFDSKKLQSNVKEISLSVSEKGALSDKISPGVLRSLVALTDKPKIEEKD